MRGVRPRRPNTVFCLAAALLGAAAARARDTTGAASSGEAAPAVRVERHSPRNGYPSLGPAGAKNTLVFFTDYQ